MDPKTRREECPIEQERERERERKKEGEITHTNGGERESPLAPLFMFFFFPLGLPYANWA